MNVSSVLASATDDVVKVEVWDVVDKGECWHTHASQISSEADLLHYINTSNRDACCLSVLSSVLMLSFFFFGHLSYTHLRPKISSSWRCRWALLQYVDTKLLCAVGLPCLSPLLSECQYCQSMAQGCCLAMSQSLAVLFEGFLSFLLFCFLFFATAVPSWSVSICSVYLKGTVWSK